MWDEREDGEMKDSEERDIERTYCITRRFGTTWHRRIYCSSHQGEA